MNPAAVLTENGCKWLSLRKFQFVSEQVERGEKRIEIDVRKVEQGEKRIEIDVRKVEQGEKRIEIGVRKVEQGEDRMEFGVRKVEHPTTCIAFKPEEQPPQESIRTGLFSRSEGDACYKFRALR